MYILWIDPWIRKLWYAIIDVNLNIIQAWVLIDDFFSDREKQFIRLKKISLFFDKLLDNFNITYAWIEKLYFTKYNQKNAEFVYWVRWILIEKFIKNDIILFEFSPKEIKKNICWIWNANKEYIKNIIYKLYWLKEIPKYHDTTDALWICYLIYKKLNLWKD